MIVQHNMLAMNTIRQLGIATNIKAKNMERLSSGYRINRAADDAASLAISEKMRAQIRGLQKGTRNVQEAISFCNVAEGALNEVHDILGRIKELAVQAASDTYVLEDRKAIEAEFTQLKDEINRISKTTEFNTMRIFDDGRFEVEFTDDVCPIKIFNATNGDPGDPNTYGGVIVGEDERIAWTTIDPDMVTINPDTGEIVFKAGEYKYSAAAYEFTITCEDGSQPPEIKVEFEVSANGEGIHIAGTTIFWEDVVNENDESILDHLGEEGNYHFRGRGGSGGLYVEEGAMLSDIIKELNRYNEDVHTRYYSVYNGYEKEQAVDVINCGVKARVTEADYLNQLDSGIKVRADENGIWLEDTNDNFTQISGSYKTWKDLDLENWNSTNDVSDTNIYTYRFNNNDVDIKFNFVLLDETSKQSVIDGLNNMDLKEIGYSNSNEMTMSVDTSGNVTYGRIINGDNLLTIEEEGMLGRDFDVKESDISSAQASYEKDGDTFYVEFSGADKLKFTMSDITYSGPTASGPSNRVAALVKALAIQGALNGTNTIQANELSNLVGKNSGMFTETFSYDGTKPTTGTLTLGNSYVATTIDFSSIGSVIDLLGTGFNYSDAAGNKYNVLFTYGNAYETTTNGYGYRKNSNTVMVDIETFQNQGINDGVGFAEALFEVFDESNMDGKNMQYSVDNGVFSLVDAGAAISGSSVVNQGFIEFEPIIDSEADIVMNLYNKGRRISAEYSYDILEAMKANVTVDTSNGLAANIDWDGVLATMKSEIASATTYSIKALDYAYCDGYISENPNKAYVSTFRFQIEEDKDEGMWIQAGPNTYQGLFMKWDGFSSHTLGLSHLSMTDREEASVLLRRVDKATEKVSGIRSAFGAYTNRLEMVYNMNKNYEENLQYAESYIRDADMATELVANAKAGILQQVAQSMLSQVTQNAEQVLSLLQ